MPRLHGLVERIDNIYYDTHMMEPGQKIHFLGEDCKIGEYHRTNMTMQSRTGADQTYHLFSIGLRILGKTRDEEDPLLDFFTLIPEIGDKPYGARPGSVCSTLRYVNEENAASPIDEPMFYLPGYIFMRPLLIPVRQKFRLTIIASELLPEALPVRGMFFGLNTRDIA